MKDFPAGHPRNGAARASEHEKPLMRVFRSQGGALLIEIRALRVASTVVVGRFEPPLVQPLLDVIGQWVAITDDRLLAFHDWEGVGEQDFGGGIELLRWSVPYRRRFAAIHFLLRSPRARAQVEGANKAFQGILRTHTSRVDFEAALGRE